MRARAEKLSHDGRREKREMHGQGNYRRTWIEVDVQVWAAVIAAHPLQPHAEIGGGSGVSGLQQEIAGARRVAVEESSQGEWWSAASAAY